MRVLIAKVFAGRGESILYEVSCEGGKKWKCTCPHWLYRYRIGGATCKHITDVKSLYPYVKLFNGHFIMGKVR